MVKPIVFAVDDDPDVLRVVTEDLRREFGGDYRVMRANSGEAALKALEELKVRNTPVALLLVDQRMPQMTGVEFLTEAVRLYPEAKRVLLTAYMDTDAAIRAINTVKIDYYLLKPWDPPEEHLYPVLQDLLSDWRASFRPLFEGIRVIGHRWSPRTHEVKDFLARNQIPYQWLDIEANEEASGLLECINCDPSQLPVVVFPDGDFLTDPSPFSIAEKIGLQTQAEMPFYDLIIIGAGPAGLAAAVYAASEGLYTVVIEKAAPGGQAGTTSRIENYLGFPVGLSGADLTRRAVAQAKRFGVEILTPQEVVGLRIKDRYRFVKLQNGVELSSHSLIIASGVSYHRLDAPGVEQLTGAGVYYGATMTEAATYAGQDVLIVGAGNSAGQAAIHFAKFARQVTMVVRGNTLASSMSFYLIHQIRSTKNINVQLNSHVIEAHGSDHLEAVSINCDNGDQQTLPASALFVFIGAEPNTSWLDGMIERDEKGFVLCGPDLSLRPGAWKLERDPYLLETNIPGVFVAGDVRHGSFKRVASAVGEGSIAVQFIHQYLGNL